MLVWGSLAAPCRHSRGRVWADLVGVRPDSLRLAFPQVLSQDPETGARPTIALGSNTTDASMDYQAYQQSAFRRYLLEMNDIKQMVN